MPTGTQPYKEQSNWGRAQTGPCFTPGCELCRSTGKVCLPKAGRLAVIRVRELLAGLEAECSAPGGTDPFQKRVTPCSETGCTWGTQGSA